MTLAIVCVLFFGAAGYGSALGDAQGEGQKKKQSMDITSLLSQIPQLQQIPGLGQILSQAAPLLQGLRSGNVMQGLGG